MDTRTGLIHEMNQGETMEDFAARLKGKVGDFVRVNGQPDKNCTKCGGTGSKKRGINSRRFKPCDCVL